jgi:ATP-dependent helicase HrpA
MLVISAGLCVTDMRVRPQEKKQEADALHARFTDPMSDFLFYVKLWDAAGGARRQSLTQLRKFCKSNFVSFTRMREWIDVHSQLLGILDTNEGAGAKTASFEQLHRCILAGLISTIAKKTKDNDYHVAKGRTAFLFPGSSLYKKKPDWIVCAELVETSRLYARTAAVVDPAWCETLAGHLCKHSYSEPAFDPETGTVKAHEKVMLFGLAVVEKRTVAYGRINQKIANELFIQDGLADGKLQTHHPFYHHNKELQEHLRQFEKKMRSSAISNGDEAIISFYQARLPGITSIHDLNALIKEKGSDSFLHMKESDLTGQDPGDTATLFPDSVRIGVRDFPIRYEFDPSSLHDGATVEVPASELSCINETVFDWIVPGFIVQRVQYLLESLPKSLKKQLEPVPETSQAVSATLSFKGEDFLDSLCDVVEKNYGLSLDPGQLPIDDLPQHLSVKVMVKKDLRQHSHTSEGAEKTHNSNIAEWKHRTAPFERKNLQTWDFSDIQDKIQVIHASKGFSVYGFPSLVSSENTVDLVVFTSRDQQARRHAKGVKKLLELCLAKDLAWMENGLKFGKSLQILCALIAKPQDIKDSLIKIIKDRYLGTEDFNIHKKSDFERVLTKVKTGLGSESIKLVSTLETVFADYHELQSMIKKRITNCNIASYRETAALLKKELQKYMINFVL